MKWLIYAFLCLTSSLVFAEKKDLDKKLDEVFFSAQRVEVQLNLIDSTKDIAKVCFVTGSLSQDVRALFSAANSTGISQFENQASDAIAMFQRLSGHCGSNLSTVYQPIHPIFVTDDIAQQSDLNQLIGNLRVSLDSLQRSAIEEVRSR